MSLSELHGAEGLHRFQKTYGGKLTELIGSFGGAVGAEIHILFAFEHRHLFQRGAAVGKRESEQPFIGKVLHQIIFVDHIHDRLAVGFKIELYFLHDSGGIDIGGGVTNVAVVSADGIIAGISMNIGGNNMDANIMQKVAKVNGLRIGALTAERIKNEIGSLSPNARGSIVAEGSSVESLRPASASVQAADLCECIRVYIDKVIEYAGAVLRKLPAEVAATVNRNGVFLSGGVMKIPHLPQYIGAKLEMRQHVCEEPQFATVLGGGGVIRDKDLLTRFSKELDG